MIYYYLINFLLFLRISHRFVATLYSNYCLLDSCSSSPNLSCHFVIPKLLLLSLILLAFLVFSLEPLQLLSDLGYKLPLFLPLISIGHNSEFIMFLQSWVLHCLILKADVSTLGCGGSNSLLNKQNSWYNLNTLKCQKEHDKKV